MYIYIYIYPCPCLSGCQVGRLTRAARLARVLTSAEVAETAYTYIYIHIYIYI